MRKIYVYVYLLAYKNKIPEKYLPPTKIRLNKIKGCG
jgi:hypothetical protein